MHLCGGPRAGGPALCAYCSSRLASFARYSSSWWKSSARWSSICAGLAPSGAMKLAAGSSPPLTKARNRLTSSRAASSSLASRSLSAPLTVGVELNQDIARLHLLAVLNMDRTHHPGLEWLNDLGAAARHDLSGRRSDDVDRAPPRPEKRRAEQQNDRRPDGAPDRRGRRIHDFKRSRQERQLGAAPRRSGAHRGETARRLRPASRGSADFMQPPPAADAGMHSGRRS